MASRETPACLARVAPVCLSLCGDAGANSGCLHLTDFILIKLKIFLIITKHSQKAMTSIFTKKSRPILVQISCLLNILFKEWKNGCNGFVNAII